MFQKDIVKYEVIDDKYKELLFSSCDCIISNKLPDSWNLIYSGRNILYSLPDEDGNIYIIKSFTKPNIIRALYYSLLGDSKAYRSYHNSILINKKINIAPNPIGFIEQKRNFQLKESFYICESLEGYQEIRDKMQGDSIDKEFATHLVDFIIELHNNGIVHRDLSPGNILYKIVDGHIYFKIVDLNRLSLVNELLTIDEAAKNICRVSDSTMILSFISTIYAEKVGFDKIYFEKAVSHLSDKFFLPKIYKWSIKNHKARNYPMNKYYPVLLQFVLYRFARKFICKNSNLYNMMKTKEAEFYKNHLLPHDVRKIILRREQYNI